MIGQGGVFADQPRVLPIDGPEFSADLTGISTEGILTFKSDGKPKQLPMSDLVSWGEPMRVRRGPLLVFSQGSLLVADVLKADKDRLDADSDLFGRLSIPLEDLSGVVFHSAGSSLQDDILIRRLSVAKGDYDRILLNNGDELSGTLEKIDENSASLQTETGSLNVERERILAVIFNPELKSPVKQTPTQTRLGFRDGSRLSISFLKKTREDSPKDKSTENRHEKNSVATPQTDRSTLKMDETKLEFFALGRSWKTSPKSLVFLQPAGGKVQFLSDLKPEEYRHVPYLSIAWPYEIDRNIKGGSLQSNGRLYEKGIGMHSAARLSFSVPKNAKEFQAEAALDDTADDEGSVRFRLFVDGVEKFTSPIVRAKTSPIPIRLEVAGRKRIDLVVDFADRADVCDDADWLDARWIVTEPADRSSPD